MHTIIVGEEKNEFVVHSRKLLRSSGFFLAVTKHTTGPRARKIELPQIIPVIFGMYVHWLYHSKFPPLLDNVENRSHYVSLCQAYLMGHDLLDTRFRNAVLNALIHAWHKRDQNPSCIEAKLIYEGTKQGDPVRRMIVDIAAVDISAHRLWSDNLEHDTCPKEFLVDLIKRMAEVRPVSPTTQTPWGNPQDYMELEQDGDEVQCVGARSIIKANKKIKLENSHDAP